MRAALITAGLLALVAAPCVANAGPFVPVGGAGRQDQGVRLAGRSVVFPYLAARYDTALEMRLGRAGRSPRTLLRAPLTPGGGIEQGATFAASSRQLVVGVTEFRRTDESVTVPAASAWAAPLGRRLSALSLPGARPWITAAAADGDRIAVLVEDRAGREPRRVRLIVRNTRTGAQRVRAMSRRVGLELDLAGAYVAFQRDLSARGAYGPTDIEVRDLRTWKLRTRVRTPDDSLGSSFALTRSGGLALVYGDLFDEPSYRAAIVRPGGRLRRVGPRPSSLTDVSMGRRGAIYPRRVRGGTRLVEASRGGRPRNLTGTISGYVSFDSDGAGAAVRTKRCVYIVRVPTQARPGPCND